MTIPARLDEASLPEDMDVIGLRLHALKGELAGFWSVIPTRVDTDSPSDNNIERHLKPQACGEGSISTRVGITVGANWRITFRFEDRNVTDVDYLDYH
jgi:plasmid maintenance system killer protein